MFLYSSNCQNISRSFVPSFDITNKLAHLLECLKSLAITKVISKKRLGDYNYFCLIFTTSVILSSVQKIEQML